MGSFRFSAFLLFTVVTVVGILSPPPTNLVSLIFIFIGVPLFDTLLGLDKGNPTPEQEQRWKQESAWAPLVILYVITHFAILALAVKEAMNYGSFSWLRLVILGITVGLYTGGLGITVAHELCHKREKWARAAADLLLASVWYRHFAIEHVRGHHFMVAAPEDPASARKNENVYRFLYRTLTESFLHAMELDQKGVMTGILVSLTFTVMTAVLGLKVLVMFLIQSVVAFLLLELVNYVEHYGLSRKQLANGRFEKVLTIHSWNSSHRFSNLLLFNLQKHSDHHARANLPYTVLKNHDEAPQLPSSYPTMILLALIPPLWFKVMNPKVYAWESMHL